VLRVIGIVAAGIVTLTWLCVVLLPGVGGDGLGWTLGTPMALSAVAALALLLWPGRRRLGVGVLIGTALAAVANEIVIIMIVLNSGGMD
jgi:hypothetical protein